MPTVLTTPRAEAAETPFKVVSIDDLIHQDAVVFGVNENHLRRVIECESAFDAKAVGDGGTSIGLAQIHLPDHPEITRDQAEDPVFAISWMARMWSRGKAAQWSCYRILFGPG